jgi:phage terminase large subunit-like protein
MPRKKAAPKIPENRAERNITWCEGHLHLPDGPRVGEKLVLPEYMKEDFRAIYGGDVPVRRAIISRPRKNGKTFECACILLLHLCGSECRVNAALYSCAQSRDQASLLFHTAAKIVRLSPKLRNFVTVHESAKELRCPELGTRYKALSSDATTAFGLNPALCIFDELGQEHGPRSDLFDAMTSATAAQSDPLLIVISTQASQNSDLLSMLIDDAKASRDPSVVLRLDMAAPDADPFDIETIRSANPAFDVFMNKQEILNMAEDARRMPSRESSFRNLNLNQRTEASTPFINRALWLGDNALPPIDFTGREVYCGLDLGESSDHTALSIVHVDPSTRLLHVRMVYWTPEQRLLERARHDHVPYDLWYSLGHLRLAPGPTISHDFLGRELREILGAYQVRKVAYDPWHYGSLRPWLLDAGFTEQMLADQWVAFRQGYQAMAPAIRDFETRLNERAFRHGNIPPLNWNAANAVVERDHVGNRRLSKPRSTGRIDGLIALVMATGAIPMGFKVKFDARALIG